VTNNPYQILKIT